MITSFREIVSRFGGPAALGGDIRVKPNTVSKWGQRNLIPAEHWQDVEDAARSRGFIDITVSRMAHLAALRRAA